MILEPDLYNHVMVNTMHWQDNPERRERDLAWCLCSPPLMREDTWSILPVREIRGPVLPVPPHPHRFRLGRHFEALLAAWLANSSRYELINHNVQVQDGTRTVGEFDFLVRVNEQVEHWEAAVKFYLATAGGQQLRDYFGPNTADRLDLKYAHLKDHQLRLSQHPVAASWLQSQGLVVARSRCFMKGRLFHPWDQFSRGHLTWPGLVNPDHSAGWWISLGDFLESFSESGMRFAYLPKGLWLAPLAPGDADRLLSFWELAEFLSSPGIEQAIHVAVVDPDGMEQHRGFIVNDQWLTRVKASDTRDSTMAERSLNGEVTVANQQQDQRQAPKDGQTVEPLTPAAPYDREAKLKELLEQDEERSPFVDPFMGF